MTDDLLEGLEGEARSERQALIEQLLADGFSPDELREAAARGRLALLPVDRVLQREGACYTPRQLAETSGVELELLRRLWRALGLADAGDHEVAYTERDLEAVRLVGQLHAGGLPEEALARVGQVLGQGMSRLAETIREVVGDVLLQAGDSERTLGVRYAQAGEQMVPLLAPLLSYVLNVHLSEQLKSDVVLQTELETGRVEGARHLTVCFADVVGFTRFGESVEPTELSGAGRRLTDLAVEVARPPVRLVKMIGDAAMLVAPSPEPLLHAALALAENDADLPPLRVGLASGVVVPSSGDWLGAPVNLASRVTAVARPGTVLATRDVRDAATERFAWSSAGARRLKGIREPVRLYRVRPATAPPAPGP